MYEAGGLKKLVHSIVLGRWYYAAVVPVQGVIDIGFTLSFVYTSAANALLLINLNPLWCAIVGSLFLNDVLPKRTIVALVLALGCMMIIFLPEMVLDEDDEQDGAGTSWRGNIIALCTGLLLAAFLSIIRKAGREGTSLIAATALGASFSTVVSAGVARGQVFPCQFWEVEMWKFWLAVIAQGLGIGIILITMVSCVSSSLPY
jgi:drug/metabolite transporter (DMT)-like permease